MADRGKYIAAILTIIRAYQACGERVEVTPFQGFNAWSQRVREPLVWLGCTDPVQSVEVVRGSDPERMRLRAVLVAWEAAFGDERMTAANVIAVMQEGLAGKQDDNTLIDLRDALLAVAGERGGAVGQRRLGNWLSRQKGRILDGMQLIEGGYARSGVVRWHVAKVDGTPATRRHAVFSERE